MAKRRFKLNVFRSCFVSILLACFVLTLTVQSSFAQGMTPIRIGWNTTWAVEGQIICVLKHTNILELNGLKGEFFGFTYGGPLSEAALGGKVDVLSAADQPSITLLAKGVDWSVISRSISFRDAILVPPKSGIKKLTDLRGKKMAVPFGSGAHRAIIEALLEAGLKPTVDVQLVNVDITEINSMIRSAGRNAKEWSGGIVSAASWDPHIAIFSKSGEANILYQVTLLGLRSMSNTFIKQNPEAPSKFLKSIAMATLFYAQNKDLANKWFANEARITFDSSILDEAASYDPNTRSKTIKDLEMGINEKQLTKLQTAADVAFNQKLISGHPDMRKLTKLNYLNEAIKEIKKSPPNMSLIKVK